MQYACSSSKVSNGFMHKKPSFAYTTPISKPQKVKLFAPSIDAKGAVEAAQRQVMMFSATMSAETRALCKKLLGWQSADRDCCLGNKKKILSSSQALKGACHSVYICVFMVQDRRAEGGVV